MKNKEDTCSKCVMTEIAIARLRQEETEDSCRFWRVIAIISLILNGVGLGFLIAGAIL